MGLSYLQMNKYPEAEKQFQKAMALSEQDGKSLIALLYAASGKRDQAHTLVDELLKSDKYLPPCFIAQIYACLNEKDQAFLWLEKARKIGDTNIVNLTADPLYKNLRSDPRFEELKNRIGFWR
jgi:tetratricopeptide (TPR) repeat protein